MVLWSASQGLEDPCVPWLCWTPDYLPYVLVLWPLSYRVRQGSRVNGQGSWVKGKRLMVKGHGSRVMGHGSRVNGVLSLVTGHCSMVHGLVHWLLINGHWSTVTGHQPMIRLRFKAFATMSLQYYHDIFAIVTPAIMTFHVAQFWFYSRVSTITLYFISSLAHNYYYHVLTWIASAHHPTNNKITNMLLGWGSVYNYKTKIITVVPNKTEVDPIYPLFCESTSPNQFGACYPLSSLEKHKHMIRDSHQIRYSDHCSASLIIVIDSSTNTTDKDDKSNVHIPTKSIDNIIADHFLYQTALDNIRFGAQDNSTTTERMTTSRIKIQQTTLTTFDMSYIMPPISTQYICTNKIQLPKNDWCE